jgi:DNA-binding response OmpR family regulator
MTGPEVLLVDDDDLHRELVADYLTLGGFAVRHAADGREALAVMRRTPPAVVLLDVQMPELDGVAVFDEMRRSPDLAAIPVVFLSGVTSPHVRVRALELGADDFVAKHTNPAELLARVRAVLLPPPPGGRDRRGGPGGEPSVATASPSTSCSRPCWRPGARAG